MAHWKDIRLDKVQEKAGCDSTCVLSVGPGPTESTVLFVHAKTWWPPFRFATPDVSVDTEADFGEKGWLSVAIEALKELHH